MIAVSSVQAAAPGALIVAGLVVGAVIPPDLLEHAPNLCPFRMSTGLPCPGCGMTRSVVRLLHGDVSASLWFHPLGPLLVLGLGMLLAWQVLGPLLVDARQRVGLVQRLANGPLPWLALAAVVTVWVVRLPLYALGLWVF
jgi:hypothetical protein